MEDEFQIVDVEHKVPDEDEFVLKDFDSNENEATGEDEDEDMEEVVEEDNEYVEMEETNIGKNDYLSLLNSYKTDFNKMKKAQEKEYNEIILCKKSLKKELLQVKKLKTNYENEVKECEEIKKKLKTSMLDFEQEKTLLKMEKEKLLKVIQKGEECNKKFDNECKKLLDKHETEMNQFNALKSDGKKNFEDEYNKFMNKHKELSNKLENELKHFDTLKLKQNELIATTIKTGQIKATGLVSLDKNQAYCCAECNTDIALETDVESQCYQVGQGAFTEKKRGYLFTNAFNLVLEKSKIENFTTGTYHISWVRCSKCDNEMGWKYINADTNDNSNKVGKFCLCRYKLTSFEDRQKQVEGD